MLCTVIKRVIPVLAVVLGYCQSFRDSGNILEWYDYTSLGGCVIPMWFMTSNWSYIEFSRHIPMYPQRHTENTFTLEIREI